MAQNNTTCLGYIHWSTDHERIFYKEIELSVRDFREFVRVQVQLGQQELRDLLLIHPDETLTDVVPEIRLRDLKDNLARSDRGWNFL
jgi:hypothetical protein